VPFAIHEVSATARHKRQMFGWLSDVAMTRLQTLRLRRDGDGKSALALKDGQQLTGLVARSVQNHH
jgi:hypothetical protein